MAWCSVKHRDNFTFTFTFTVVKQKKAIPGEWREARGKTVKATINTTHLEPVLYGCKTWSLTLRGEQGAVKNIWT
jgi:hypothetical protein